MTETTNELLEQLKTARTVQEITPIVVRLLNTCGIFNYQGIGNELARLSVTADLDGFGRRK